MGRRRAATSTNADYPAGDVKALLGLQERLGRLKTESFDRFTDGELEGKGLMAGFLAHVRDARDYRTGLIAQARESPAAPPESMEHSPGLLRGEGIDLTRHPRGP
jgi:hypothetical protein